LIKPGTVEISVVIPVYNESESIPALLRQIDEALGPSGKRFEMIFVDDGSTDRSWSVIREQAKSTPKVIGLHLSRNYGQTAALRAGIDRSQGEIIVTMDGDLQNDPADIPKLLAKLDEGYEIVTGWRRHRRDRLFSRRFPSRIANRIVRTITGTSIHDQGCALKAYRGRILRSISLYSDFHRFVVPLTQMGGARVAEIETNHRHRKFGESKYGLGRTFRVVADLTTLMMITRFGDRLLLWFLLLSLFPLVAGIAAIFWTGWIALSSETENLLVPIGAVLISFQTCLAAVCYGLLAERIRHLTPLSRHQGNRLLATRTDSRNGTDTVIMIQHAKAIELSGGPIPLRDGGPRSDA